MGDYNPENSNKKRLRDDSGEFEHNPPELKRVHTNAYTDPTPSESQRVDIESNQVEHESEVNSSEPEGEFDSPEARMIREGLLDILDDTETVPAIPDLDSVIRSFEEEIRQASPSAAQPVLAELTSDSGDSQPDLGYLLEASDDELGLPPTVISDEVQAQNEPSNTAVGNDELPAGLDNMAGFEDDLQSYEAFGMGLDETPTEGGNGAVDFVTVDGLFEASDFSDFAWQPESLPAL